MLILSTSFPRKRRNTGQTILTETGSTSDALDERSSKQLVSSEFAAYARTALEN